MRVSGLGRDNDVWGLSSKDAPPPDYAPWLDPGIVDTGAGGNIVTPIRTTPDPTELIGHGWTPCAEIDGVTPTQGDANRSYLDITLLGAYGGDIRFPVMPEEFGADFTHEYWTPRVVGLGEIVMPGGQSMETISWDSFFPAYYDDDYVGIPADLLEDPKSITARLIWTMRFKMNCMLIVGGGIWTDQVVITNFNYRHKAGEIDDIYYTISLKRYRAPVVSTSINPDAVKDTGWPKDPRGTDQPAVPIPTPAAPVEDNPAAVPVVSDPVATTPPSDHTGGRDATLTVETTLVLEEPLNRQTVIPDIGYVDINDPDLPDEYKHPGETLAQVRGRVNSKGPNDIQTLLALNQWVTDNNYDPYTSPLKVGSGVRYYQTKPVAAGAPTTIEPQSDPNPTGAVGAGLSTGPVGAGIPTGPVGAGQPTGPVGAGLSTGPVGAGSTIGSKGTGGSIGMPKSAPVEKPKTLGPSSPGGGGGGGFG
jgi:hypothetical protein